MPSPPNGSGSPDQGLALDERDRDLDAESAWRFLLERWLRTYPFPGFIY
jgi:hypothetical protein